MAFTLDAPRDLGVGIGLRKAYDDELLETPRELDWIEVIPENVVGWSGRVRRILERCRERWPVVPHGVSLNVGGLDPLDVGFLDGLRELCARVDAPFFSDHLCFSRVDGVYLHDLVPLPFSDEAVEHAAARIRAARDHVGRPFLLENPSYYAVMPGSHLDEAAFYTRVAEAADCGLLLDVNNVYVNAQNHGYDARAFFDAIPLDRVWQVHLAGHEVQPHVIVDTHGAPVPEPVWDLYRDLLERIGPVSTLLEWDANIPSLDAVLDEADRARALRREVAGA